MKQAANKDDADDEEEDDDINEGGNTTDDAIRRLGKSSICASSVNKKMADCGFGPRKCNINLDAQCLDASMPESEVFMWLLQNSFDIKGVELTKAKDKVVEALFDENDTAAKMILKTIETIEKKFAWLDANPDEDELFYVHLKNKLREMDLPHETFGRHFAKHQRHIAKLYSGERVGSTQKHRALVDSYVFLLMELFIHNHWDVE